ncbi:hypothetical protein KI387_010052, partial [Taxus chinensis]
KKMALCLRNRFGCPVKTYISCHNSGVEVRWGRAVVRRNNNGTAPPYILSAKKYNFEEIKVCQDHPQGILCYRDQDGEVICEGYDEGPYFRPSPGQQQEEQYRKDVHLYSIIQGVRLYLVEGIDYTCIMGQSLMGLFFEGEHELGKGALPDQKCVSK